MKKGFITLLVVSLLLLSGCSGEEATQNVSQPDSSYENQSLEPKESLQESAPADSESRDEDEPKHLPFYDQFGWYNEIDYFEGFNLSEAWVDGEPYYQLWNEEKDVRILVDKTQENAVIYHNGRSMEYRIGYLMSHTYIHLLDLTNDGKDELIIYRGEGGSGTWEGVSTVFNMETFQEYEIDEEKILKELGSRITVEPLEMVKNDWDQYLKCRVRDDHGNSYIGYMSVMYDFDLSEYAYLPESFTDYYSIELVPERQCLVVSGRIRISPEERFYLGTVYSPLAFNSETGSFELTDEFTFELGKLPDKR